MPGLQDNARARGPHPDAQAPRDAWLRLVLIFAIIGALWAFAASRWFATDLVVPWDSKNQFYAFFRFLASSFAAGEAPFWNPFHYGGHPAVADPQSLIFAPVFALWAWFDPAPSIRTFDLLVYAHLLAGGLAIAMIGWRARWPATACVLAAVIFMFGGAASGRLQHTGLILSYGVFPVALLLAQVALQRKSFAAAFGGAIVAAAMLLGRNQASLLLFFFLAAAVGAEIAGAERPLRYLRERAAILAVMAVTVGAIVALPMLLTLQFAAWSNRPAVALDTALKGSLHPANLATLAIPNIFGSHQVVYWGPNYRLPEIQFTDQSFNYLFVGIVPMLLLFWLGIAGGGALRRGRLLLAGVLAISLLYMLGRYTPFFAFVFDHVPGVNRFRRPVDGDFALLIALSLMCGWLLADFIRDGLPKHRGAVAALSIAAAAAMLISAVAFAGRYGQSEAAFGEILKSLPVFAAALALLLLPRHMATRAIAAAALTFIAAGELIHWNVASYLNAQQRTIYAVLEHPPEPEAKAIDILDRAIRAEHRRGEYPRVEIMGVGGPWENLAVVRRWEATNGYNPLRIGFYDRLVSPGEATFAPSLRVFPASFDGYDCALARALGLEFVVLDRPIEQVARHANSPVADVLLDGPKIWIYRLHNPMPRVKFTSRVQIADAEATSGSGKLLHDPSPDKVLIDEDTPPEKHYSAVASADGVAKIVSWRSGRVEIDVEAERQGVLAMHGTYYPGWVAEIDGRETPILRADVLFRAVEVPAGRHRVVFRFAPFSLENITEAIDLIVNPGE